MRIEEVTAQLKSPNLNDLTEVLNEAYKHMATYIQLDKLEESHAEFVFTALKATRALRDNHVAKSIHSLGSKLVNSYVTGAKVTPFFISNYDKGRFSSSTLESLAQLASTKPMGWTYDKTNIPQKILWAAWENKIFSQEATNIVRGIDKFRSFIDALDNPESTKESLAALYHDLDLANKVALTQYRETPATPFLKAAIGYVVHRLSEGSAKIRFTSKLPSEWQTLTEEAKNALTESKATERAV